MDNPLRFPTGLLYCPVDAPNNGLLTGTGINKVAYNILG